MSETQSPASSAARECELMGGLLRPRDVVLNRGSGRRVWDRDGREYLDFTAGYGTAPLGHAHPRLTAALTDHLATDLLACPTLFAHDGRRALLEDLRDLFAERGGMSRFFLCNSGTEAVEAAIKIARFSTGRSGLVAVRRGFHGRTMGALSATSNPAYREPFAPLLDGVAHVPFNDPEALDEAVTDDVATVLVEVVQGEGGVHVADATWLETAQDLCRQRGAMLVVDEVQTGFGRTGRMFAFEHGDLRPDLVCLAKGMGGGFPVGCVAMGNRVPELDVGLHGSTFGGNPLAATAARETIRVILEDDLVARADVMGAYFREQLGRVESPIVREIRGLGLMIGLDLRRRALPYLKALQDEGVLALLAGSTVLRFLPPLTVERSEMDAVVESVQRVLERSASRTVQA